MAGKRLVFGLHAVRHFLIRSPERVRVLYAQRTRDDRRLREIIDLAVAIPVAVEWRNRAQLDGLAGSRQHQGVVANIIAAVPRTERDLSGLVREADAPLILVLDGIQDPHNLGACLRTADAAGVDAVLAPRDRAVGLTPAARKVASGAAETVPFVQVTNLARVLRKLQSEGVWLIGAAEEARNNVFDVDLTGPVGLVLGAEGAGLRRLTRQICDDLVRIPTLGAVESLNVSVAAGVCLFEALRQRLGCAKKRT